MRDYTKYEVWNDGVEISIFVYDLTRNFPDGEKLGLCTQLQRASVSIPSNFAEGCSRSSEKEFRRYLEISLGSSFELKTQLIIAHKLTYISIEQLDELIIKIDKLGKQLNTLRNKLK